MADQTPDFIPAAQTPDFIPSQSAAPDFIPAQQPQQESTAHKIWSRAFEPVRMEEVEKTPGLEPERAEALRSHYNKYGIANAPETSWFDKEMLARAAEKSLTDFYSPGTIAMRVTKPVVQIGAGAGFTLKQLYDLYENWDRLAPAERWSSVAGAVGGGIMTMLGAGGLAKGKPAETKATEEHATPQELRDVSQGMLPFPDIPEGESAMEQDRRYGKSGAIHQHTTEHAPEEPVTRDPRQGELFPDQLPYNKVGFVRHWFDQPIMVMRDAPEPAVARTAELISQAAYEKAKWFSSAIDNLNRTIAGFGQDFWNKGRNIYHLSEILDNWAVPQDALGKRSQRTQRMFSSDEVRAANHVRIQLLNIWEQLRRASGAALGPFRLGFIQNYLPHLEHIPMPERLLSGLREAFFDTPEMPTRRHPPEPADSTRGRALSGNIFRRYRRIADERLEYDLRRLMPSYLRGVSRVLFDRPAILAAENQLKRIGDSTWRQYADSFLDKYAGKRPQKYYEAQTYRVARRIMDASTRTLLGLSLRLQELHLARLLTTVWPNMQTRDFAFGLGKVASNPRAAYRRAMEVGILPQTVPLKFMSGMQRIDAFANYLGMADFIDRSVAFEGQFHRYLREGLGRDIAAMRATQDAKDFSFLSAPESTPLAFGRGAGGGIGDAVSNMALQYKHIPTSILYQYIKAMRGIRSDPIKAAKFTAALATAAYIQYKTGARLVHMGAPFLNNVLGSLAAPIGQHLQAAWKWHEKGNERKMHQQIARALESSALLLPGAFQVERVRHYGWKALLIDPNDAERKAADRQWRRTHMQ
jgi:hypothetical protein